MQLERVDRHASSSLRLVLNGLRLFQDIILFGQTLINAFNEVDVEILQSLTLAETCTMRNELLLRCHANSRQLDLNEVAVRCI